MGEFLHGKVVAVTGAGRGIGRAVALACAAEGARVVVNDYGVGIEGGDPTSEVADGVVKEIQAAGGEAVAVADDVSTMAGGERVVRVAVDTWGRLDGAVCVAGILRERMLFNMSEEEWDPVLATHLKGTFTVFRAASALMRRQNGGRLVGFTSGNHTGSVSQANYSAAKGGIISLVRSAALGLHKYGVTANCVAPVARTRMSANVPMELKEIGEPEDVAALVVYLLSEQAAALFYGRLFEIAPSVKPLFKGDMTEQGRKLMATLAVVVNGLTNLETILPAASALAKRHVGYGVKPIHYPIVSEALL